MEVQVIIKEILPAVSYQRKDGSGEVKKYAFIGEVGGQYPNPIRFEVFGKNADAIMANVNVGQAVSVSFDIRARQWNGKWFNDVVAWKVSGASGVQPQQQQPSMPAAQPQVTQQPPTQGDNGGDGLPF